VSFNHDIVDGAPAARFLKRFSELLTSSELLCDAVVTADPVAPVNPPAPSPVPGR
jgi:hypothetical protein